MVYDQSARYMIKAHLYSNEAYGRVFFEPRVHYTLCCFVGRMGQNINGIALVPVDLLAPYLGVHGFLRLRALGQPCQVLVDESQVSWDTLRLTSNVSLDYPYRIPHS